MRPIAFLFMLLLATQAPAAEMSRCGTDAFGNDVCIDKDGVLTTAPLKSAGDGLSGEAKGNNASAGSTGESGVKSGREDQSGRARCGIDSFGNEVCR